MHNNIQAAKKQIREKFAKKLDGRLEKIHANWKILEKKWIPDIVTEVRTELHQLAGSSLIFGFKRLGEIAKELEAFFLLHNQPPKNEQSQQIVRLLKEIKQAAQEQNTFEENLDDKATNNLDRVSEKSQVNKTILLIEDDAYLANFLSQQIESFGYTVKIIKNASVFPTTIAQPYAMIVDIVLPEGDLAGTTVVSKIQSQFNKHISTLFISVRDDIDARLAAVSVGGNAYLNKPIDFYKLIEWLDSISNVVQDEPYRILIVDDDSDFLAYNALILEQEHMRVQTCIDPMQVLEKLKTFSPDLILMDMYMQNCLGSDIVQVIRQLDGFVTIPIVYISAEKSVTSQLNALLKGGDDFLMKPIWRENLIKVVSYRAMRFRQLRNLMVRDSLTGLLNHRTVLEQLKIEVERANRTGTAVSFVMIDLDKFKRVNDTYGHGIGDQVLKTLARFLKQRFRVTDPLGRYGGEEFAIILPNVEESSAKKLMEEVRKDFSQLLHQAKNKSFKLTFSCGIASYPKYHTAKAMADAADAALFESKDKGRNKVTVATKLI
jgi:diguanylate cyclase (GGDEF)-like protein